MKMRQTIFVAHARAPTANTGHVDVDAGIVAIGALGGPPTEARKRRGPRFGRGENLPLLPSGFHAIATTQLEIDLDGLIAGRGADTSFIRMAPVPCPRCGGRCTETRIRVPGKTTQ